eukprot:2222418-Amphidinium_carterae.2
MHKLASHCKVLLERFAQEEDDAETDLRPLQSGGVMEGGKFVKDSLKSDQRGAAKKVKQKLDSAKEELLQSLKGEFAIAAGEAEFQEAMQGRDVPTGAVSVRRKKAGDGDAPQSKRPKL